MQKIIKEKEDENSGMDHIFLGSSTVSSHTNQV